MRRLTRSRRGFSIRFSEIPPTHACGECGPEGMPAMQSDEDRFTEWPNTIREEEMKRDPPFDAGRFDVVVGQDLRLEVVGTDTERRRRVLVTVRFRIETLSLVLQGVITTPSKPLTDLVFRHRADTGKIANAAAVCRCGRRRGRRRRQLIPCI